MKNKIIILTILFCLSLSYANAQSPILTGANSNFLVGEKFTANIVNYLPPGNPGANQIWDFSILTTISSDSFRTIDPSTANHASEFPNATVATFKNGDVQNGGDINIYYLGNDSQFAFLGHAFTDLFISYSDPEIIMKYPFSYQESFTDSFASTYAVGTQLYYRKGTMSATADGYGTLILPNGMFNNVLRVLTVENYIDSTGTASDPIWTTSKYNWYLPGIHFPVFFLVTYKSAGVVVFQSGGYLNQIPTSIDKKNSASFLLTPFPNPVHNVLTIKTSNKLIGQKYFIADVSGKAIFSGTINNNKMEIDLRKITSGTYFFVTNGSISKRFKFVKK